MPFATPRFWNGVPVHPSRTHTGEPWRNLGQVWALWGYEKTVGTPPTPSFSCSVLAIKKESATPGDSRVLGVPRENGLLESGREQVFITCVVFDTGTLPVKKGRRPS